MYLKITHSTSTTLRVPKYISSKVFFLPLSDTRLFENHAKLNTTRNQSTDSTELLKMQQISKMEQLFKTCVSTMSSEFKLMELHIVKLMKDQIKLEVCSNFMQSQNIKLPAFIFFICCINFTKNGS